MELHADRRPLLDDTLDRLDDAVGRPSGDTEARRHVVDRHVVHAVDANLAVSIHPLHHAAAFDEQRVAVGQIGRILVGNRPRQILGQVEEERSPLGDVQQLHAAADREHGHVPGTDVLGEQAVEVLPPRVHRPHRRVWHVAVTAGIEVGSTDHHDPVEHVEKPDEVVLVGQGGEDHGDATRRGDAVEIAGRDERQRGMLLATGTEVGVDADDGLHSHETVGHARCPSTFSVARRRGGRADPRDAPEDDRRRAGRSGRTRREGRA